ncbi:MAG: hypothetical protein HOQ11_00565 [Gemmatimonadaceae bacterium]|nr:hypothetical protein [Gemmatimonadaceae bacterium]NUQ94842.1 hypothetical protein [Gemmatimonadaceae bacterium]NUR21168.1 hypothetical protein [Gemmatimonadaceae bacterium]NUS95880.1 hypothetical protein [Gemmatimonadaceae bacterium]
MSSESDSARPEIVAFQELSLLVRHLEDELATFRKRALAAESRIKELEALSGDEPADVVALARENADLKKRLDAATARTRQLLERVRFVRQQGGRGGEK